MPERTPEQTERNRIDDALLLALACGATRDNAAQKAGLSVRTVSRRLADPKFRRRLQRLRTEMVQRAGAMLVASCGQAVSTLVQLMAATYSSSTRLGAA